MSEEPKPLSTIFVRPKPEHVRLVGYENARDIQAEMSEYMRVESERIDAELEADKRAASSGRCDRCLGPIEAGDRIVTTMEGKQTWHRSCLFASAESVKVARRANQKREQVADEVDPRQEELFR